MDVSQMSAAVVLKNNIIKTMMAEPALQTMLMQDLTLITNESLLGALGLGDQSAEVCLDPDSSIHL